MKNKSILKLSFVALFAAIICAGCFLKIPLGPVPIVLQNALCILTGTLLGGILGGLPTALFLVAGLIGLPVYSGGSSGIGVWAGPTGGFLSGYLIGAVIAGFIAGKPSISQKQFSIKNLLRVSLAIFAGMTIIFVPGIFHFARWAAHNNKIPEGKTAFSYAMKACVIPFIPGFFIKIGLCIPVALKVRPMLAQYLFDEKVRFNKDEPEDLTEEVDID